MNLLLYSQFIELWRKYNDNWIWKWIYSITKSKILYIKKNNIDNKFIIPDFNWINQYTLDRLIISY